MAYNERPRVPGMGHAPSRKVLTGPSRGVLAGKKPTMGSASLVAPRVPEPELLPESPSKLALHVHVAEEPSNPSSFRDENMARHTAHLKMLSKHPALTNDKLAAAITRHAIKKEIKVRKADMMHDQARNAAESEPDPMDQMEADEGENETPLPKSAKVRSTGKGMFKGNPYEMKQLGGGVVVRNSQTGKVHGHFATKREASKQFRLLEAIEHDPNFKPRSK